MGGAVSDIRTVHTNLVTLLEGLSIAQPHAAELVKAWKYTPPRNQAITDYPCAFTTFEQRPITFHSGLLHKPYTLHIQLLAGRADVEGDLAADVAAAFLEALIQALSADITLGGSVSLVHVLRGETPETLVALPWAGQLFIGLDLYLEVTITEAANHAA